MLSMAGCSYSDMRAFNEGLNQAVAQQEAQRRADEWQAQQSAIMANDALYRVRRREEERKSDELRDERRDEHGGGRSGNREHED